MMSDEQIAHLGRRSTEFNVGDQVPGTPYLVVARIGQGGMGSVYEVEHRELGKRFVLKALLDQFCQREDLVQRLRNEWRSLGRLEHPNIVSVSDAGMATNGAPFYVMERLQGESLAGALARLGRLSLLDSMRLAAEVLEGLAAAHEIGIVHRDVKPPNIFITQTGAAKLLDFGIAKLTDGAALELTGRGIAIGTPRYMSPEQAAGERVDGRADLYAVGLVLFEMLTGNGPFDGCESHEVFLAHITRQPPRLSDLLEGIPPELDGLVASLLAKRPHERPQSAATAAGALRSMLRTYLSLEQMPDTQGEELEGVLTPMVQGEFIQQATPGQAAVAGLGGYAVSGNGPTASVSQVPPLFLSPSSGAAGSFPTPAFEVRPSTPPGYERKPRGSMPPSSGSDRSWNLVAQSSAPSTRTAHPGPINGWAGQGAVRATMEPKGPSEATPSGVSHSTSAGELAPRLDVYPPSPRKFPLWVAVGAAFGAALAGAWLVGGSPNEITHTKAETPSSVADQPIAEHAAAPTAPLLIPKPQTVQNVAVSPQGSKGEVQAGAMADVGATEPSKVKATRPKPRTRDPELLVAGESGPANAERPPVARPLTERESPAPQQIEHLPAPGGTEKPAAAPKKPARLPTSGIGGL